MGLVDDAKQLLNGMDPGWDGICMFCYGIHTGPNTPIEHKPGCVYLRRGKIVAALEAAQAVIGDIRGFIHDGQPIDAMGVSASRLESALKGGQYERPVRPA